MWAAGVADVPLHTVQVKTDLVLKPEALDRVERRIRELQSERKLLLRTAELDASTATDLQGVRPDTLLETELDQCH